MRAGATVQSLHVPVLPGLNELIRAKRQVFHRGGKRAPDGYRALKARCERMIGMQILRHALRPVPAARFVFEWIEPNRRRDPDNVAAGGRKFILDALVRNGILPGDGWRHVRGWEDRFRLSSPENAPGVLVTIEEDDAGQ